MHPSLARRRLLAAAGGAALLGGPGSGPARAQDAPAWPARPVRIVIPFTPGGSNDVIARPLAERLQARLGQPFVLENRPGAGSAVGVTAVTQAPPDGYTLLVTTSAVAALAAVQHIPFDAQAELDAVALLARAPLVLLVAPSFPARTVTELVQRAKAHPAEVNYASSGPGSVTHLAGALFNLRAGLRMQHVPYRGTAPALTDLMAGRVQVMFTTLASAAGQIRDGRVRLLAYAGEERPDGSPPAPTVRASGLDYEAGIWWGLFAPHGLPAALRERLNGAVNAVLGEAGYTRYLQNEGAVPSPLTPAAFATLLGQELARSREVVAAAEVRAD